jgi:hypothetical protein
MPHSEAVKELIDSARVVLSFLPRFSRERVRLRLAIAVAVEAEEKPQTHEFQPSNRVSVPYCEYIDQLGNKCFQQEDAPDHQIGGNK